MKVLVTGASSGIGADTARLLAQRGDTVGLVARREDRLREVLADCGENARMWVTDLGDLDAAERVALEAWEAFGAIDVLVNNAAIPKRRKVLELTADEVEETLRVNFLSPVRMTLALLPKMIERGGGTVVNVSSLAGRLGVYQESAYSASKFALSGWSEAAAIELVDTPVNIRLITPGAIDTEIWDRPGNNEPVYVGDKVPAADVARAILEAVDGASFETWVPDMKSVADMKHEDIDGFLAMQAEWSKAAEAEPGAGPSGP
ncbi:MAG: SDR family NAD(P)-dependent oxidoreductase [Actinobacteria bacterium]|nr:SDR family NAD(P)-dependent oxidoreductase [Actinomycetota bacterium]